MSESEKKVVVVTETAKEKAAAEKVAAAEIAEKNAVAKEPATKVVVEKKDDATFVSVSPVGSKEYTDELAAFELEHAIKAVVEPESPK